VVISPPECEPEQGFNQRTCHRDNFYIFQLVGRIYRHEASGDHIQAGEYATKQGKDRDWRGGTALKKCIEPERTLNSSGSLWNERI